MSIKKFGDVKHFKYWLKEILKEPQCTNFIWNGHGLLGDVDKSLREVFSSDTKIMHVFMCFRNKHNQFELDKFAHTDPKMLHVYDIIEEMDEDTYVQWCDVFNIAIDIAKSCQYFCNY